MTNTVIQEWTDEKGWVHQIEIPLTTFLIEHNLEQVVRCKGCKHYIADGCDECQLMIAKSIIASINDRRWYSDFYCAWGERREDEVD